MNQIKDKALSHLSGEPADRDAIIEECAKVCDEQAEKFANKSTNHEYGDSLRERFRNKEGASDECATAIRSLKQQPSQDADLDKRDAWNAALDAAEDAVTTLYEEKEPPYLVEICGAIRALADKPVDLRNVSPDMIEAAAVVNKHNNATYAQIYLAMLDTCIDQAMKEGK